MGLAVFAFFLRRPGVVPVAPRPTDVHVEI